MQSSIPADGTPFYIEIYADKTTLSSFGTQKAYPVVARWAQLPHHIRNGIGLGAGRVIGMLPIVCIILRLAAVINNKGVGSQRHKRTREDWLHYV